VRRVALLACAAIGVVAALPAAAAPPVQLPALTRIAATLSGLPAKRKPVVRVVSGAAIERQATRLLDREHPAARQAYEERLYRALGLLGPRETLRPALLRRHVRGVRGLYDPQARVAYVRAGATVREATLHELVHALQDQAFDLRRLARLRDSRDAGLGAAAAVEGHATLVAAAARGTASRVPSSHGGRRIDLFLELESEFPYATGARFAATVADLGGRPAAFGALRRFPETTEQIFHVDAFLSREQALPVLLPTEAAGMALAGDDTWGVLDVCALLAIFQVPRLDHVGEGWGGGRSAIYRDAAGAEAGALVLRWDGELDAAQWEEAVASYVNEAFDADRPGRPATTACGGATCWSVAGRSIAFRRVGASTALVLGPDVARAATIASALA
jgi:hypothetical protein